METFETLMACVCAAVAAFCLTRFAGETWETLTIEKKSEEKRLPLLLRLTIPFAPNLRPLLASPWLNRSRENARGMIAMAGYDSALDADRFLAARIILAGAGAAMFLTMAIAGQAPLGLLFFLLLIAWPNLWLRGAVRRRHNEIQKALPNVLDLLTLSVEAGKDFVTALRDILARRRQDALREELEIAFHEIQLGKQRRFALLDMAKRVRQHDLTQVVNAIAQADELGVSIGNLLRVQSDQLRVKRFQRAEKLANEAPVKILFPVVVFIFPSVFIILLGPIVSQAMKTIFR